jgi:2-polyprenyl-6-methoxyphenol hydroxylase-like FAD-dependent oxidoreductase
MSDLNYEIVIVGAGPAGLAAALTLSAYSVSFALVDANTSALQKLGDALPPNAKPLLRQLGILDLLNHPQHIPYYGNNSSWGSPQIQEKAFIENVYGHGYLLDRPFFENQLRQLVKNQKQPFYEGHQLKKVTETEGRIEATLQNGSNRLKINAALIIDATGRKASVCRHLGVHKHTADHQIALCFWHEPQQKMQRQIWVEATENGWWYISPDANNRVNVLFFTLKNIVPKKEKTVPFLADELQKTKHIRELINPSESEFEQHQIMPAGTSYLEQPYGEKWLAVGDAAFSYDPISSYGITSALASGFYGAHAVSAKLKNEEDAFLTYRYVMENGSRPYLQKLSHQYSMEQRWNNSYYWKNRFVV